MQQKFKQELALKVMALFHSIVWFQECLVQYLATGNN